jgi:hypothetical protein
MGFRLNRRLLVDHSDRYPPNLDLHYVRIYVSMFAHETLLSRNLIIRRHHGVICNRMSPQSDDLGLVINLRGLKGSMKRLHA